MSPPPIIPHTPRICLGIASNVGVALGQVLAATTGSYMGWRLPFLFGAALAGLESLAKNAQLQLQPTGLSNTNTTVTVTVTEAEENTRRTQKKKVC